MDTLEKPIAQTTRSLKQLLNDGQRHPELANHVGIFLAHTLFKTSALALNTPQQKSSTSLPAIDFCETTENAPLKLVAQFYKEKIITAPQALLHGQLYTKAITTTKTEITITASKTAFYGPMGFDIGTFIGSLLQAYFTYEYHGLKRNDVFEQQQWLLQQIISLWQVFTREFIDLWNNAATGYLYNNAVFNADELKTLQKPYLLGVLRDSMGFAGLTLLQEKDFSFILDAGIRSLCQENIIACAEALLLKSVTCQSIFQLVEVVKQKTRVVG